MPTKSGFRIGSILGIPIYLHASWLLIFALITYSLGMQFTQSHPQWSSTQHWTVGVLTSLLFFASVLFHELSHSVVAMHYKIRVASITLFIFGGVARIGREPSKAIQEFNIAIAGPLSSYFLCVFFFGLTLLFPYSDALGALGLWLAQINFAVATFNLLPGFPLDGGRIFRAAIWGATKDFTRATRVASVSGQLVAYGLILMGAWFAVGTVAGLYRLLLAERRSRQHRATCYTRNVSWLARFRRNE
jgi:Zn-dependent protease